MPWQVPPLLRQLLRPQQYSRRHRSRRSFNSVFGGYHTPWFITPPHLSHPQTHPVGVRTCYHTPWFITPPNVPCGWSNVLSHPLVYHTPWGPPRPALYHRGYTRYHPPHRIPHPVIIFSSAQMYHRGCVILCSLRYVYVKHGLNFFWLAALRRPSVSSRAFGRGAS